MVTRSTIFKSNKSQAVRLPKAVAFPEDVHQVEIIRVGNTRIISPVGKRWDEFFDNGPRLSDDFSVDRDELVPEEREILLMLQYMLDTNICIYVMNEHPKGLREKFNHLTGLLCISSIALAELRFGAEKSTRKADNLQTIMQFVSRLDILPFGENAAAHYGEIRAAMVQSGRLAGPHDMLIGAHARAEGLIVVTNNTREFERMPGVRTENWV